MGTTTRCYQWGEIISVPPHLTPRTLCKCSPGGRPGACPCAGGGGGAATPPAADGGTAAVSGSCRDDLTASDGCGGVPTGEPPAELLVSSRASACPGSKPLAAAAAADADVAGGDVTGCNDDDAEAAAVEDDDTSGMPEAPSLCCWPLAPSVAAPPPSPPAAPAAAAGGADTLPPLLPAGAAPSLAAYRSASTIARTDCSNSTTSSGVNSEN